MNTPLVTIAIPFLNPGPLFKDAVRSVFCQTVSDWELILIDDGSTDESTRFAHRISDDRVRLISDGRHLGLVVRLNQIADLARGEYLARMDADDVMAPTRLERQMAFLEANCDMKVVSSDAVMLDDRRLPVGRRCIGEEDLLDVRRCLRQGVVIHAAVLARRTWFRENRYDPEYVRAEDRELFIRVLGDGGIAILHEPLYFIYVPARIPMKSFLMSYQSERKVMRRYGPDLVGNRLTFWLHACSMARSCSLPVLYYCGLRRLLTGRLQGIGSLTASETKEAQRVLDAVLRTSLPGAD